MAQSDELKFSPKEVNANSVQCLMMRLLNIYWP